VETLLTLEVEHVLVKDFEPWTVARMLGESGASTTVPGYLGNVGDVNVSLVDEIADAMICKIFGVMKQEGESGGGTDLELLAVRVQMFSLVKSILRN
jgi:hypothetical protein